MQPKRALTSVDIAALVTELRRYTGATVDKIYLYPEDLLRIKLRDYDAGRLDLLAAIRDPKRVHLAARERVPDAPERPPNFAMMLRNRITGGTFLGVEQFEFDRIMTLRFERGETTTSIVLELFGDGNIAVLDETGQVVSSLDTVRLKSRTVAPGSTYGYPASRFDPLSATREQFGAAMEESDTDLVRTIATQLNFGGLWGEELCRRAGVEPAMDINEATATTYDELWRAIEQLRGRLKEGDLDPRLYYEESERPVDATPLALEEYAELESEQVASFNDALDRFFEEVATEGADTAPAGPQKPEFEALISRKERILDQQESAIERFEREADAEREKAELVYAEYETVEDVLSTIREAREQELPWTEITARIETAAEEGLEAAQAIEEIDGTTGRVTVALGDEPIEVELLVAEGVERNADRLYNAAKELASKKAGAQSALEETATELEELATRRREWSPEEASEDEQPEEEPVEAVDWTTRSSVPIRQDDQWYERFRWVRTGSGFLVIGGRNADQNEELVKKYMETGDRFFHTQAHGAPVTVLKATGPSEPSTDVEIPPSDREAAAQFAVSYSSVWSDGRFTGDVYEVGPDQVSKTPESGEFLQKGGFAVRGDREYYDDTPVGVAVGIQVEPYTRVIGGPPAAVAARAETHLRLEPGQYAQNDIAMMLYRRFREAFTDQQFVRKVASADRIQEFCPPGGSRIVE